MTMTSSQLRKATYRPEERLLLYCSRTTTDPKITESIRSLLHEEIDWTYLTEASASHGVVPLLYRSLGAACRDAVPDPVMETLHSRYHANALRNLLLTRELLRILDCFQAQGIPVAPFRGPVLAESVYGDISLRQFLDLDILVRERDVLKASEILLSLGYRAAFSLSQRQAAAVLRFRHHYSFLRDDERVLVELHWRLGEASLPFASVSDRLWERLEPTSFHGRTVLAFRPEDLLLICCSHAAKHVWIRLEWLCDVAETIRAYPEMSWEEVEDAVRSAHNQRVLYLGLYLANHLLGTTLPHQVLQKVRADRTVRDLAAHVRQHILRRNVTPARGPEAFLFHFRIWDRLGDRAAFCFLRATRLLSPTPLEWELLRLPDCLFPLYYLFRPVRLMVEWGMAFLKRLG